jgi:hypothetical protein
MRSTSDLAGRGEAPQPTATAAGREPTWDTGTGSAHVAVDELTHLPPEGRADAATAGVA